MLSEGELLRTEVEAAPENQWNKQVSDNADKFGLFFKLMPDKYYVFKGETCHGGKASKERLTVLACANSDGSEKLRLLVIGKAKNPRCLKNIRSFPVTYDAQSRAWMTGLRFIDWLKALDNLELG
ncbi:DDE superfamily endonuclease [Popillia japonica]|uniref:DDE superfamily endonuclease n=1 Tax=Popillia japonica TaxID=7064 RepID=A0AAW1HTS2_POPJA